jgi:dephospho-CoA kinase
VLRVGLTGGLGSGKSTAAAIFASLGAHVFYADEIGRELMQPGEPVFSAIVETFGPSVVGADGTLDRPGLARIAFGEGRIEELNAIVHPATIARQAELIAEVAAREPDAVTIVESALIFETKHGGEGGWQTRFDCVIFITAPEPLKIARFIKRSAAGRTLTQDQTEAAEAEARRRLAQQAGGERNSAHCHYVLTNDGPLEMLRAQVEAIWPELQAAAKTHPPPARPA